MLPEVPAPVRQGDRHHGGRRVSRRAKRIPRKHAKATGVGGNVGRKGDLHREVRDGTSREVDVGVGEGVIRQAHTVGGSFASGEGAVREDTRVPKYRIRSRIAATCTGGGSSRTMDIRADPLSLANRSRRADFAILAKRCIDSPATDRRSAGRQLQHSLGLKPHPIVHA